MQEIKGAVTVTMLAQPVRVRYRVLWGVYPHVVDAYISNPDGGVQIIGHSFPDAVRVAVYDAILADAREQEIEQMAERKVENGVAA